MMEQEISAVRIANSIMQEGVIEGGAYVLLEGVKDIKVYNQFFDRKLVRIRSTFGKYKQREVYRILSDRGFSSKLGVRDADFLRVHGNEKFDPNYCEDIFVTDGHDSEVMIISSGALRKFLLIVSSENKIDEFESRVGVDIRSFAFNLAEPIGRLRYCNKKFNLGLSFKPHRAEGKQMKFSKFICEKTLNFLGQDEMVNYVMEYSKNRDRKISPRAEVIARLNEASSLEIPIVELVNGHDLSEIISMIVKKGLKSDSDLARDQGGVENSLALAYEWRHFQNSKLFANIKRWSQANNVEIIQS